MSLPIQKSVCLGKHFLGKECREERAAASREKCSKNQPRTQKAFCQSHSLDAHFCRGGVLHLGGLAHGIPSIFNRAREVAAPEAWAPRQAPYKRVEELRDGAPHPRAQRLPCAHLLFPRPWSCSTSPQTPLCDRFLDFPTDPPPFRSLLQESTTSLGQKPFPDKRSQLVSDSRHEKGVI